MHAKNQKAMQQVLSATVGFRDMMTAGAAIKETYRTDDCVVYHAFPAGSTNKFTAIEVRLDVAFGEPRLTMSHSSNKFEGHVDAMAQAQAMVAAAGLMAQIKVMMLTVQASE
jgi:hypothetical protein